MLEQLKQVKFHNRRNPNSQFDFLRIEELFHRKGLDHSIENLHRVDFFAILFIEAGSGKHSIDFSDFICEKGTLLTIRKDQIHRFHKSVDLRGILMLFTNEFLVSYLEELETHKAMLLFNELLATPKLQLSDPELTEIQSLLVRIQKEYFEVNDVYSLGIIRSELHILVTKLFRIKTALDKTDFERKYLKEFIALQKLVEAHARETTKVGDYARMMGLSSKTLNTVTKSIVHKTAKEFVDEICVKQIKRLLLNTEFSIKEIAFQSGFEETTNFYKYFKRHTQSTPEQFRRKN